MEHVKAAVNYIRETLQDTMELRFVNVDLWVPAKVSESVTHRYKRQLLTFISKHPFPFKVCYCTNMLCCKVTCDNFILFVCVVIRMQ